MNPFAWAERISARLRPKVRLPPPGRHEPDHDEREDERAGVGDHVRRVREERERVGEDAGDDLRGHQPEDQRERDPRRRASASAGTVS